MNHRQYEYAVQLAKVRNFSQLSNELGISQPALSKHIATLERELGVTLFDRTTSPLTVTPAGEQFVAEAERLLYAQKQLHRKMEQFKSGEAGRLTIGVSPFRCMYLMPSVVKAVREKFPNVEVVLHELPSAQLRQETLEGKFDFSILNLPVDESVLDTVPIQAETLVLAVPNTFAKDLPCTQNGDLREVAFADCVNLPFVTVGEGQEMRQLFDKICAAHNAYPPIAAQVVSLSVALEMASAGIGATLLPLPFLNGTVTDKPVTLFTIRDNAYHRQSAVVMRKGQYLSACAQFAIAQLTDA